jgi:radical SAM enzyme (TIGR01210 family)
MNNIAKICKDLKKGFSPRIKNSKKLVSCWTEKDVLDEEIVDAFVIILRTGGCSWARKSGCSMCGYFNDSAWDNVASRDLLVQFESAMEKYSGQKFVKIFTSGSFLDDTEIKPSLQKNMLLKLFRNAEKTSVESRPEFISEKKLNQFKDIIGSKTFEVGIGLETADDNTRKNSINKGFEFHDYEKAAKKLEKYGIKLKTYVLIKPPFLTERQSMDDAIKTVDKIKNITDSISFNPTNVQHLTLVNYLWQRKKYRPPWLFSVVEILKESKKIAPDLFLKCDISGGGSFRGAHNCRSCDSKYLYKISNFSLNQDAKTFDGLGCECKKQWLDQLDIEDLSFGSIVDFS